MKQGCYLSPTLFSVFANDLAQGVNTFDREITIVDAKVAFVVYADGIVRISIWKILYTTILYKHYKIPYTNGASDGVYL